MESRVNQKMQDLMQQASEELSTKLVEQSIARGDVSIETCDPAACAEQEDTRTEAQKAEDLRKYHAMLNRPPKSEPEPIRDDKWRRAEKKRRKEERRSKKK